MRDNPDLFWWDLYTDKSYAGEVESPLRSEYKKVVGARRNDFLILLGSGVMMSGALVPFLLQLEAPFVFAFVYLCLVAVFHLPLPRLGCKEQHILHSGVAVRGLITEMTVRKEPDSNGILHDRYFLRYEYPRVVDGEMQELNEQWTEVTDRQWWNLHRTGEYMTIVYNRGDWKQHLIYDLCEFTCLPAKRPFFGD